jgi:ubiquinone/menaquinone biosynthesis C-methylase UbiE
MLEVGCGAGESSKKIYACAGNRYFEASEFDERYVTELMQLDLPFRISQESVYEMKRESNSFDMIFLLEVLEHLEFPDPALRELFRVSSDYVIISVPNEPIWSISNIFRFKYLKVIDRAGSPWIELLRAARKAKTQRETGAYRSGLIPRLSRPAPVALSSRSTDRTYSIRALSSMDRALASRSWNSRTK